MPNKALDAIEQNSDLLDGMDKKASGAPPGSNHTHLMNKRDIRILRSVSLMSLIDFQFY